MVEGFDERERGVERERERREKKKGGFRHTAEASSCGNLPIVLLIKNYEKKN